MARVVLLSGGTGGAKLAAGLQRVVGSDLTVIANTGDDVEIYGSHVSPDPDLITFWLAGKIDERGWGLAGDSFNVMDGLRDIGRDVWFNLGDRDLAICLERKRWLESGGRLTTFTLDLAKRLGLSASVIPMTDDPVRTVIKAGSESLGLQEFLIARQADAPIDDVVFSGAEASTATEEALTEIEEADLVLIGPSNPVISIEPILAVPGIRDGLKSAQAPVVAVSPIVNGNVLKGPTAAFMQFRGVEPSTRGFLELYDELSDGFVVDEKVEAARSLVTDIDLSTDERRISVAEQTVEFGLGLTSRQSKAR